MATTVIIPARNEVKTVGAIVNAFSRVPETRGQVYVGIDADTNDGTTNEVWANGGCTISLGERGKGQVVRSTLALLRREKELTDRIILCDADYTGFRPFHIHRILRRSTGLAIGVPDWPTGKMPPHVIRSWPRVSGFRHLPWRLIPDNAHGYLLETQINLAAIEADETSQLLLMPGLKAPFQWPLTPKRMTELLRDQKWGREHGIL